MSGHGTGTDVIRLIGLGGVGRHGVLPEERRTGQLFKVDLAMHVDTRAAAESDDLAASVDYSVVAGQVVGLIEGEPVNLIETLAARIADAVLAHPGVQQVEVTVHKPEAPVGVPFTDVEVSIVRGEEVQAQPLPAAAVPPAVVEPAEDEGVPALDLTAAAVEEPERAEVDLDATPDEPVEVVLGMGGNVGDVRSTLRAAIDDLAASGALEIVGVAPLAKTAAVLQPDAVAQADFLNTVVAVRTTSSPRSVLALVHEVEQAHGRVRGARWGERTLDIDIITYGSVSTADPELSLPHPRANERAFVLVPWAHLDPDAFLPGLGGGPVAALAETAPDRDGVRWLALDWYLPRPSSSPAGQASPAAEPAAEVGAFDEDVSTSRVDTSDRAVEPEVPADPEEEAVLDVGVEPVPTSAPDDEPDPAPEQPVGVTPDEPPVEQSPEPTADEPAPVESSVEEPAPDEPAAIAVPAEAGGAPSGEPWEAEAPSEEPTRIRPRWEPLRREERDS